MAAAHDQDREDSWAIVARLEVELAQRDRQLAARDVRIAEFEKIVERAWMAA